MRKPLHSRRYLSLILVCSYLVISFMGWLSGLKPCVWCLASQGFLLLSLLCFYRPKFYLANLVLAWFSSGIASLSNVFSQKNQSVCLFSDTLHLTTCAQQEEKLFGLDFKSWAFLGMGLLVCIAAIEQTKPFKKE